MRLGFVGDIALGDHPKAVGFGFSSRYAHGIPASLASRLVPPGEPLDLLLGNLEFPLGGSGASGSLHEAQCSGLPQYASFLAAAGVKALNVATNHTYQHGAAAFEATLRALRACGIHVVGTPDDFTEAGVFRARDRRIALLGWCDRPRQYSSAVPPYNEFSEAAYAQIAEARSRTDVVIASIHWGDEFILIPSDRERQVARAMIDAGASAVIAHHPHVVREIEHYRDSVIAYSLGNFIGDMTWDLRTRLTCWLTVQIGQGASRAELKPGMIDEDYFPRPLTRTELKQLSEIQELADAERKRISVSSYSEVAEAERRRHARRTARMMLRNAHRYPRGYAAKIFGGAISHRLQRVYRSAIGMTDQVAAERPSGK